MPHRRKYRTMQILGSSAGIMLCLLGLIDGAVNGPTNHSRLLTGAGFFLFGIIQLMLDNEFNRAYDRANDEIIALKSENRRLRGRER